MDEDSLKKIDGRLVKGDEQIERHTYEWTDEQIEMHAYEWTYEQIDIHTCTDGEKIHIS
jgi:hypothetical protein